MHSTASYPWDASALSQVDKCAGMPFSVARLQSWIGQRETLHDTVSAAVVQLRAATHGHTVTLPQPGAIAPPLAHWLLFVRPRPPAALDSDGIRCSDFLPPIELPRRLWAGSRIDFRRPLHIGEAVRRETTLTGVRLREGRSGTLVIVTLHHAVYGDDGLAVEEEQDTIYCGPPEPVPDDLRAAPQEPPATFGRKVQPDPVLLFRHAALTFNAHRIHYDRPYATEVGGYAGLVVQGALTSGLLMDLALQHAPPGAVPRRLVLRAERVLCDPHPFTLNGRRVACGNGMALWAADHHGRTAMRAQLDFH